MQGKITLQGSNFVSHDQHALYVDYKGTAEIKNDVFITGFINSGNGTVYTGGTLVMSGGTIRGNTSYHGGVCVASIGTFTMTNGLITGNTGTSTAKAMGGYGIFNWQGGSIQSNLGSGPVIYVQPSATFNNTSGNTAS